MENDFDALILSVAKERWQKVAMVISKVLEGQIDEDEAIAKVIARRIKFLVRARKLEGQGNLSLWRHSEVRLPSNRSD